MSIYLSDFNKQVLSFAGFEEVAYPEGYLPLPFPKWKNEMVEVVFAIASYAYADRKFVLKVYDIKSKKIIIDEVCSSHDMAVRKLLFEKNKMIVERVKEIEDVILFKDDEGINIRDVVKKGYIDKFQFQVFQIINYSETCIRRIGKDNRFDSVTKTYFGLKYRGHIIKDRYCCSLLPSKSIISDSIYAYSSGEDFEVDRVKLDPEATHVFINEYDSLKHIEYMNENCN